MVAKVGVVSECVRGFVVDRVSVAAEIPARRDHVLAETLATVTGMRVPAACHRPRNRVTIAPGLALVPNHPSERDAGKVVPLRKRNRRPWRGLRIRRLALMHRD
jgi:hypothetical protein